MMSNILRRISARFREFRVIAVAVSDRRIRSRSKRVIKRTPIVTLSCNIGVLREIRSIEIPGIDYGTGVAKFHDAIK